MERKLTIDDEDSIVNARQLARTVAKDLGFGVVDQARIATAVSELARNVIRYARPRHGEVSQVLKDGFTTGTGLGMGLRGTKRLMDEMSIESTVGSGTTVIIRKWRR